MSGKTPAAALRAGTLAWKSTMGLAGLQARGFSYSAQLQAQHVIHFPPTSNTELDNTLAEIRRRIIIPSYLSAEQRHKLYSQRYKEQLDSDPITVEIDGEVLRFRHENLFTLPNTRKLFLSALRNMKTAEDLKLLPRLLEGICVQAGRKLPWEDLNKIIRKTQLQGCFYVALDCVAASKRTNFRLTRSEVVNNLLTALQEEAINKDFERESTEKMLAWSVRVIEMLEDPAHKPRRNERLHWTSGFPLSRDPQILSARLHLAAALALKHNEGKDEGGKVAKYADEIVKLWPSGAGLLDLHEKEAYTDRNRLQYLQQPNGFLWYASPILNGLNWASQVVQDQRLSAELQTRSAAVEKEIQQALADLHQAGQTTSTNHQTGATRPVRGLRMYQRLFVPGSAEQSKTEEDL
ncbi:hypothetical protein GQ53DRAFT_804549 [Thozetella sp. PMI_491]|nr:hypothetical protein GQ53DRAFT_804549 [Thozetella sp. PMI_491]